MAFGLEKFDFQKLTPAKKALVIGLVVVFIFGMYWYLGYRSKARTLNKLRVNLEGKARKLNENQAIARNLPRFKEEVEKLNLQLSQVVQELPNSREIPNLLEQISNLGAINGLEVVFIKPNNDVDKGFYAEVPIQVKVRGGYHEVGMFLDAVSRLPRIINFQDLTMGGPKPDQATGRVILDVGGVATTYRYIEKGG